MPDLKTQQLFWFHSSFFTSNMPPTQSMRGAGFSQVELDSLLDLLKEHLPISCIKWERVETAHKRRFPAEDWSCDLLKREFQDLYCTKMPTGDLYIPVKVRRAEMIHQMMEEHINLTDSKTNNNLEILAESSDGPPNIDNNSSTSPESPSAVSTSTARPLVKVPLILSARRRKSLEEENSLQDILQVFKLQVLQMQQDRKEADERRLQEREEAQRICKEDRRQRRENKSAMNRMIMAMMMTVAPDVVSRLAPLVEGTVNKGNTHKTNSTVDKGDYSATSK